MRNKVVSKQKSFYFNACGDETLKGLSLLVHNLIEAFGEESEVVFECDEIIVTQMRDETDEEMLQRLEEEKERRIKNLKYHEGQIERIKKLLEEEQVDTE